MIILFYSSAYYTTYTHTIPHTCCDYFDDWAVFIIDYFLYFIINYYSTGERTSSLFHCDIDSELLINFKFQFLSYWRLFFLCFFVTVCCRGINNKEVTVSIKYSYYNINVILFCFHCLSCSRIRVIRFLVTPLVWIKKEFSFPCRIDWSLVLRVISRAGSRSI